MGCVDGYILDMSGDMGYIVCRNRYCLNKGIREEVQTRDGLLTGHGLYIFGTVWIWAEDVAHGLDIHKRNGILTGHGKYICCTN